MTDCLDTCGHLCAATGRWADAITVWTAYATRCADIGMPDLPQDAHRRQQPMRKAGQALGPAWTRAAEERGAAMTLATAGEFATVVTDPDSQGPQAPPGLAQLSAREQELVTLIVQGRTDAQIAGQLCISVRTVRSPPRPHPRQDRLPAPRRSHPPGPADRPRLASIPAGPPNCSSAVGSCTSGNRPGEKG
jgi:DNA-binding CsgD family transcriptional regulator